MQAVLDTYQVQQLLAKLQPTKAERDVLEILNTVQQGVTDVSRTNQCRTWLSKHVIYWSKKDPYGLRFQGDNAGPGAPDPNLYANQNYRYVSLFCQFRDADRERFRQEWAQRDQGSSSAT